MKKITSTLKERLRPQNAARGVARFHAPGYLNWIHAGWGLKYCGEGLIDFCEDKIKTFHQSLIDQHCNRECPFPNKTKKITYDSGSSSWKVNCACGVCDEWLKSIESQLGPYQFSWENTDVKEWPIRFWQLAKIFMDPGTDATNHDPAKTDIARLLQLISNCKLFAGLLDTSKTESVRQVRNDIMRSDNLELTSADLTTYLTKMADLLQEPELQKFNSARKAVVNINNIEATSLDFKDDDAVVKLEQSLWTEMIEDEQNTNKKKDLLEIIASDKVLQKRLGDVYRKLKDDVQKGTCKDVTRDEIKDHEVRIANLEAAKGRTDGKDGGEKAGPTQQTPCKSLDTKRLNKNHTENLTELYKLREKNPERLVPNLKQISMCDEKQFRIGEGRAETAVYLGIICRDGRQLAVKRVIKQLHRQVECEVQNLVHLSKQGHHHRNIVDYVLVEDDETYTYIATELCDFTINEWISKKEVQDVPGKDWRKQAADLVRGILSGLEFMHTNSPQILHKDVKPENILVVMSANGEKHVKITDFDTSHALKRDKTAFTMTNATGTMYWRPRVVIEHMYATEEERSKTPIKYRASDDIQSAGMVCFYIMSRGIHPYAADDDLIMVQPNVKKGNYNLSAVEDPVACDLVRLMLTHEPSDRPTAGELLRHAYFLKLQEQRQQQCRDVSQLQEQRQQQCRDVPQLQEQRQQQGRDVSQMQAGEKLGSTRQTTCIWRDQERLNKTHTENLRELYQLREKNPERLVPNLQQISMCDEEQFRIGKGREGTEVYLGVICRDGRQLAVKRVLEHLYKRIEKEVLILTYLSSHPNIVDYVLVEEDEKYAYIATELCDFNVEQWLGKNEVRDMPEEDWRKQAAGLVRGILSGLEFMHTHSPKILHKDLKPENILVVASANGERHIKIADFDTSRALERDATASTITNMGTSCWRPRVVVEYVYAKEEETSKTSIKYRASGDIQSAGMVCFYIMSRGIHPYAADDDLVMVQPNVMRGKYDLSAVEDPVACDLVRLMLTHEPSVPPTAGELLRHPYFWSDETRYKFLAAIGDQQEVATFGSTVPPYNATVTAIENADVLPTLSEGQKDWGGLSVIPELGKDFQKKFSRPGYTQSVCNLLRTLRNIHAHYGQESGAAQRRLGSTLNPYAYFNAELPKLFLEMYIIIKGTAGTGDDWVQREALKTFFS